MLDLELHAADTGIAIVDVQQKLAAAMPEHQLSQAIRNWTAITEMAARLRLPIAVSEQYPKGLGPTLPLLREILGKASPPPRFVEKLDFACTSVPAWKQFVHETGRKTWIVVGMECHVCVFQTVRGLLDEGMRVQVPSDAVLSRTKANWRTGLRLMDDAGALVTSTETALFDLVKKAEGETFKALSRLVR
jgi:nicotinamidase-related amidase